MEPFCADVLTYLKAKYLAASPCDSEGDQWPTGVTLSGTDRVYTWMYVNGTDLYVSPLSWKSVETSECRNFVELCRLKNADQNNIVWGIVDGNLSVKVHQSYGDTFIADSSSVFITYLLNDVRNMIDLGFFFYVKAETYAKDTSVAACASDDAEEKRDTGNAADDGEHDDDHHDQRYRKTGRISFSRLYAAGEQDEMAFFERHEAGGDNDEEGNKHGVSFENGGNMPTPKTRSKVLSARLSLRISRNASSSEPEATRETAASSSSVPAGQGGYARDTESFSSVDSSQAGSPKPGTRSKSLLTRILSRKDMRQSGGGSESGDTSPGTPKTKSKRLLARRFWASLAALRRRPSDDEEEEMDSPSSLRWSGRKTLASASASNGGVRQSTPQREVAAYMDTDD